MTFSDTKIYTFRGARSLRSRSRVLKWIISCNYVQQINFMFVIDKADD